MSDQDVRIVRLEPVRVASVHGFGMQPEAEAWEKLVAWAKPKCFLDHPQEHRIFGFNNPSPSPGSPNYGYEFWITVGPEILAEGEIEVKDFTGGNYAVARWDGQEDPYQAIPATWKKLVMWREDSPYQSADHQWLEERLEPEEGSEVEFMLDLYLPIVEQNFQGKPPSDEVIANELKGKQ
jgi:DNA gyrase inhibitor GyrI